jgi:uncharacterized SAM-binding protein YcdF (DUF218 family)
MSLRYVIWHDLSLGNLLALALIVGVVLHLVRWRRLGHALIGISAAGWLALLVLPLGNWAIDPLEARFPVPRLTQPVDGILLLTGAINVAETARRGQPVFFGFVERVVATATLARRFPAARILISGGSFKEGLPSEAAAHRDLLVALGIPADRILLEERSHDTCESAVNSRRMLPDGPRQRWLLVTSAFHMPRSVACFRHVGWDIEPYPAGYEDQGRGVFALPGNLRVLTLALHEWLGLAAYRALGWTDELFPAPHAPTPGAAHVAAGGQGR